MSRTSYDQRLGSLREHLREWSHDLDKEGARLSGESSGLRWGFFFGALFGFGVAVVLL